MQLMRGSEACALDSDSLQKMIRSRSIGWEQSLFHSVDFPAGLCMSSEKSSKLVMLADVPALARHPSEIGNA